MTQGNFIFIPEYTDVDWCPAMITNRFLRGPMTLSFLFCDTNQLLAAASILNQWMKRRERIAVDTSSSPITHPTAVTATASPKHIQCSVFMLSTSIKTKETKSQVGTAQTPVIQRHPHQFSPVLWLCSLGLHQADTSRAGSGFPAWHTHRAPSIASICTANMKLQPEFKQKHFWSIP